MALRANLFLFDYNELKSHIENKDLDFRDKILKKLDTTIEEDIPKFIKTINKIFDAGTTTIEIKDDGEILADILSIMVEETGGFKRLYIGDLFGWHASAFGYLADFAKK